MPKRSKSRLSHKKRQKHFKNKVHKPTPSQDEILTRVNSMNYEHITSEEVTNNSTVLHNINPTEPKREIQEVLPVVNRTMFIEAPKVTTICAPDNATDIKSKSEVEIHNKSSNISKMDSSESNNVTYKVLKLEDMINLWNELSKIAVPQCRCSTNRKKNK